jgi:hypothetical protein
MINNNITLNLPPALHTNSCEASTIGGLASLHWTTGSPSATGSPSSPLTAVSLLAASPAYAGEGGTLPAQAQAHFLSASSSAPAEELGTKMESALAATAPNYVGQGENIINLLFNLADVLSIILPVLLSIAFMTIIERKQLAAHQRRVGPNTVGYYGILQPFADALKLILKETIIPSQSNKIVFYLAPVSTLVFSLLGWAVIPFGEGIVLSDLSLGILYTLALSSLGVYGVLLAGWSANSKYAFLGSLRSTAAMISYELILSSAILIIILLTGTLNYTSIIEIQQSVWFIIPLLPVFIFYFISILAETSRTPFDLQEAKPVF